jgi:hypothetical protein
MVAFDGHAVAPVILSGILPARGTSTGTHVHIARKYNGEWMLEEGMLALTGRLISHTGSAVSDATLATVVTACSVRTITALSTRKDHRYSRIILK